MAVDAPAQFSVWLVSSGGIWYYGGVYDANGGASYTRTTSPPTCPWAPATRSTSTTAPAAATAWTVGGLAAGTVDVTEPVTVTHDLTMDAAPLSGGTISPAVGSHTYSEGAVVDVTATPNTGYHFDNWTGGVADPNAAATTVTMDADKTVTAHFAVNTYTLTYAAGAGGSISGDSPQTVDYGHSGAEVTAVPAAGYHFVKWSDDVATAARTDANVTANLSVTAQFAEDVSGQVVLDETTSTTTGAGAANAPSVSFTHTTGSGSNRLMLVGVSWNCNTTNRTISSVTFTPSGGSATNLTEVITQLGYNSANPRYSAIYALLAPPSHVSGTVTVTFSGTVSSGSVAGAADFAGVDQTTPLGTPEGAGAGDTKTATARVTLDNLRGNELVFDNVFGGVSSGSPTVTPDASQSLEWDTTSSSNARGSASSKQATSDSVTMTWTYSATNYWAITAVPIRPVPGGVTHDLTMGAAPLSGGTISPAVGSHTYSEGAVVDVTATPSTGYHFAGWSGDLIGSANPTTVTMDADKAVTAHFAINTYTLTYAAGTGGSVSGTSPQTVDYGQSGSEVTAVPDAGYHFVKWSDDVATAARTDANVTANLSVTAQFAEDVSGQVVLDGTPSSGKAAANAPSVSFAHTTGTGTDRLMLVGVSWNSGTQANERSITSLTFTPLAGQPGQGVPVALTQVIKQLGYTAANPRYSAIYKLLNPPPGVSGTVTVTFSGTVTNGSVAGAADFAGVDQTTPLGTAVGFGSPSNTSTSISKELTGLAGNELVFDNVFAGASSATALLTPDSSQHPLWNVNNYASGNPATNLFGAASTKQATSGTVTMSWTFSSAAAALAAVPIRPAE